MNDDALKPGTHPNASHRWNTDNANFIAEKKKEMMDGDGQEDVEMKVADP